MTTTTGQLGGGTTIPRPAAPTPRFRGLFWQAARLTSPLTLPLAGKRWNPIFAVVEHRGRRTGRRYAAPVAARRVRGGFVIALAFGAHVDWYRNLLAAGSGDIRWRGDRYPVSRPELIGVSVALATFNPVQRLALRAAGVDGYVRVADARVS
jgi:deazaflavin-dependent oxidoreductase (nitroreductase family)